MTNHQVVSVTSVDGDTVIDCANRLVAAARTLQCGVECMFNGVRLTAHPNSRAEDLVAFYNQRDNHPTSSHPEPAINPRVVAHIRDSVVALTQGMALLTSGIERESRRVQQAIASLKPPPANEIHLSQVSAALVSELKREFEQFRVVAKEQGDLIRRAIARPEPCPAAPMADAHLDWCRKIRETERRDAAIHAPINFYGLSHRAFAAIHESECRTPAGLAEFGEAKLYEFRGVGPSTVAEIAKWLHDTYGLQLGP